MRMLGTSFVRSSAQVEPWTWATIWIWYFSVWLSHRRNAIWAIWLRGHQPDCRKRQQYSGKKWIDMLHSDCRRPLFCRIAGLEDWEIGGFGGGRVESAINWWPRSSVWINTEQLVVCPSCLCVSSLSKSVKQKRSNRQGGGDGKGWFFLLRT